MTPEEAGALVDELGDAFWSGDVDTVLARFAPDGEVVYAGSEPDEVAVGRPALRGLLESLFDRDERYRWHCGTVHVVSGPGSTRPWSWPTPRSSWRPGPPRRSRHHPDASPTGSAACSSTGTAPGAGGCARALSRLARSVEGGGASLSGLVR